MGKKPLNENQVKSLRKLVKDKPLHELYSGPHKWDNVLRCIFNQMEIPNGQKKVQQGIEGSNRAWRKKESENDSSISLRIWGTCKPKSIWKKRSLNPAPAAFSNGKHKEADKIEVERDHYLRKQWWRFVLVLPPPKLSNYWQIFYSYENILYYVEILAH